MDSRTEFVLVGEEDEDDEAFDLSSLRVNEVFPVHQTLYWEAGEEFTKGERAGELNGTVVMTGGRRAVCLLVFSLDDGHGLVAAGVLPLERAWDGERHIAITGGTGNHARARGTVAVSTRNPKRYGVSFDTGG